MARPEGCGTNAVTSRWLEGQRSYWISMRHILATAGLTALLSLSGCAGIGHGVTDRFAAYLKGGLMAPGVRGDPDASGMALLWIAEKPGPACYEVDVRRLDKITEAHLHRSAGPAPWPSTGPAIEPLRRFTKGKTVACFQNLDHGGRSISEEIKANPSAFYFDVHTEAYPAGALRGKVEPASPDVRGNSPRR